MLTIILFIFLIGLLFSVAVWTFFIVVGLLAHLKKMWLRAVHAPIDSPWLHVDED